MKNKRTTSNDGPELRNLHIPFEIRQEGEDGPVKLDGYAVKYNQRSHTMYDYWGDAFTEEFAAGAFDESLLERNQKALWNHDSGKPLGSVAAGTMDLVSDNVGLRYIIEPPSNTWGNDAIESIKRGDVDGSSFAFKALDDIWSIVEIDGEEVYKRTILKAEVREVSPTTFPAYPDSSVGTREFKCREYVKTPGAEKRQRLTLIIDTMIGGSTNG